MNISHTLSTYKQYVSVSIVVLAMTLFLAGCPSPNGSEPMPSEKQTVTITSTSAMIYEGSAIDITLERDMSAGDLTVQLDIKGNAESVSDYETLSDTVTFKNGEDTATITLTAGNDRTKEEEENVIITIEPSDAYTVGDHDTVTITIIDQAAEGSPTISISAITSEVNEGENITITVRSNIPVTGELTVSFTIDEESTNSAQQGDDYELDPAGNTVTITDEEKSATITIRVYDDNNHEEDETIVMSIDPSSNYHINGGERSATVTILNDDLPTVGFRATSQTLHEGDDEGVTIILERSNDEVRDPLTVQLTIEGTATIDEDYELPGVTTNTLDGTVTATVTIPGDTTTVTFTITVVNDGVPDNGEEVVITIKESGDYTIGDPSTATLTIVDPALSDAPVVSISTSDENNINEDESISVTITSNQQVPNGLEVSLIIGGDATIDEDFTGLSNVNVKNEIVTATVIIPGGDTKAMVTIEATDDSIHELAEDLTITIDSATRDYSVLTGTGTGTVTVTITDDDLPTVGFRTTSQTQTLDEGDVESVTVTVERSNDEVLAPLKVQLSFKGTATEGDDYEVITRSVTIGSGENAADFTLQLRDDDDVEGNEEVIITISEMPDAYTIDEGNNEVIITIVSDETNEDDIDGDTIENSEDVDDDNNGLIEIHNLDMLRNVHFNLAGTSYDDEEDDSLGNAGDSTGCPSDGCKGYELTRNLDFSNAGSYAADTINTGWRPDGEGNSNDATNEGFPGIGAATGSGGFAAIFEGNGYTISNLYMRSAETTRQSVGLFRRTENSASIRNLGVIDVTIYGGTKSSGYLGGLVASNEGIIIATYAIGDINAGRGGTNKLGGLVASNEGIIIASYATVSIDKGSASGWDDIVGGLVGFNKGGTIIASYATGDADGGAGDYDAVGGLVGNNRGGTIIASYATGSADGGGGADDTVGGLVGSNSKGTIIASYATGDADGGGGADDYAGGLVGNYFGTIIASYGFGDKLGHKKDGSDGTTKPILSDSASITTAKELSQPDGAASATTAPADAQWNAVGSNTLNAWDFGTNSQNPVLKYADYDGPEDVYSCNQFPAKIPGTIRSLRCGYTLLSGQER